MDNLYVLNGKMLVPSDDEKTIKLTSDDGETVEAVLNDSVVYDSFYSDKGIFIKIRNTYIANHDNANLVFSKFLTKKLFDPSDEVLSKDIRFFNVSGNIEEFAINISEQNVYDTIDVSNLLHKEISLLENKILSKVVKELHPDVVEVKEKTELPDDVFKKFEKFGIDRCGILKLPKYKHYKAEPKYTIKIGGFSSIATYSKASKMLESKKGDISKLTKSYVAAISAKKIVNGKEDIKTFFNNCEYSTSKIKHDINRQKFFMSRYGVSLSVDTNLLVHGVKTNVNLIANYKND